MSRLTLLLPGLPGDWPEPLQPQELPQVEQLARLMGQGNYLPADRMEANADPYQRIAAYLGWPANQPLPTARLRLLGEHIPLAGEGYWLCADPVTLKAEIDHALVFGAGFHQVTSEEAAALIATLNAHFSEDGWVFHAPANDRWYLQMPESPRALTTPLWYALRRNAGPLLPKPANAQEGGFILRRALSEIEMLLYSHPVNERRARQGQPQINSLWLHGEGEKPLAPPRQEGLPSQVFTDDALVRGLARWAGIPVSPLHALAEQDGEWLLAVETASWLANLQGDIQRWSAALSHVNQLLTQRFRQYRSRLIEIDTLHSGSYVYLPWHRWRFWRRQWQFPRCGSQLL